MGVCCPKLHSFTSRAECVCHFIRVCSETDVCFSSSPLQMESRHHLFYLFFQYKLWHLIRTKRDSCLVKERYIKLHCWWALFAEHELCVIRSAPCLVVQQVARCLWGESSCSREVYLVPGSRGTVRSLVIISVLYKVLSDSYVMEVNLFSPLPLYAKVRAVPETPKRARLSGRICL